MEHRQVPKESKSGSWRWYLALLPPFVATLWVPFYNSVEPSLGGIPFFYWYQLAWIVVSTGLTAVVYFMTRSRPSPGGPRPSPGGPPGAQREEGGG
jgi:hypothetical protein